MDVAGLEHFIERVEGRVEYEAVHSGHSVSVEFGDGARGHACPHGVAVNDHLGLLSDGVPSERLLGLPPVLRNSFDRKFCFQEQVPHCHEITFSIRIWIRRRREADLRVPDELDGGLGILDERRLADRTVHAGVSVAAVVDGQDVISEALPHLVLG